ncbi:unnamed protein product, partial [Polarella glacialis]
SSGSGGIKAEQSSVQQIAFRCSECLLRSWSAEELEDDTAGDAPRTLVVAFAGLAQGVGGGP